MNKPSIERIHEVMKEKGMVVFTKPYDVTMGGIRTKDNKSNEFNDWLFMSMFTEGGGIISVVAEGTTDAGLYYRLNPLNIEGTAIIQHGVQHRGVYQYQNPATHPDQRGHRGKEAFRQIKDMKYWRDADRDEYLEFGGKEFVDNFATNGHDMGKLGVKGKVNKWSAGCWGSEEEIMELFYELAHLQIAHDNGDKFSYALLHEDMF